MSDRDSDGLALAHPVVLVEAAPIGAAAPAVFTVDELAGLLRVERKTIYAAVQRNEIPGVIHVGRLVRFARDAVLRWLSEGQDPPRSRRHR